MSFVNHCKIASSNNLFQRCVNRYLLTRTKFLARVVCILRKQVFSYGGKFEQSKPVCDLSCLLEYTNWSLQLFFSQVETF